MGGLQGDLGYLYKVYFSIATENDVTKEDFGVEKYKIRNKNNSGYRYYDKNNETLKIGYDLIGGVFVIHELQEDPPKIVAYFMSDDKDLYELVSGEVPPKNKEEEEGLKQLKNGLRRTAEEEIKKIVDANKKVLEEIAEIQKKNENGEKKEGEKK